MLILLFQGLGELASKFLLPAIPGPVLGLIGLLAWLFLRGQVSPALGTVSDALSQHLGLLFVPAAVGVVLFLPQLRTHWLGVAAALVISVAATIAVTALLLRLLSSHEGPR